jgi:hypothetical protein
MFYVDIHALSEHAGVKLATKQRTLEFVSDIAEEPIEAAARKRAAAEADTPIIIDEAGEIPVRSRG